MNPKIQKLADDIEKLKRKILDNQTRLRDMERQKTDMENADIIAMVRGVDIPPDQFAEFARMFKEQYGCAVPDMPVSANIANEDETVGD